MEASTVERPSWLDVQFIEDALRSREGFCSIVVLSISVQLAVSKGENFTSLLYRVTVEFKRKNGDDDVTETTSLIVKGLSTSVVMAKFLIEAKIFEKETALYQITLPAMYCLLQQKHQGRQVQHLTPVCYKTSRPHTLILEDLTSMGFKMADRRARLDLHHSTLALKGLARFHAMSVALHEEDPSSMDAYVENIYTEQNREVTTNFLTSSISVLASVVEKWSGFEEYGDKLRGLIPTVWDRMVEIMKPAAGSLSVLNHGDCWVNNMMFHYCPFTGEADQVRFLDFQLSRYTSPALDLQYFMYTSPREDVRYEYTDHLLEEYLKELHHTLKFLGCEHRNFTIEQLKREFEERSFYGLIAACTVLTVTVAEPTETFDMENISEDGKNMDLKSIETVYSGSRYKQIFQELILHFEKKGLL
jgi:hypothetical protein